MEDRPNYEREKRTEDFYKKFKKRLDENHNFPENYTFKFIIESHHPKLLELHRIFDEVKRSFTTKDSRNGKYVSCTIVAFVLDADQVIRLYKEAAKIENVFMM